MLAQQLEELIVKGSKKAADNLIVRTTKRAMRIIYNSDNEEVFNALMQGDGTLTMHNRNFQKLMVEIHTIVNQLNLHYKFGSYSSRSDGT